MQRNYKQILLIFLGVGFVLGVVYENVIYIRQQELETYFQDDVLQQIKNETIPSVQYLLYVLRMRLRMLIPIMLFGLVKWKRLFVNSFLLWIGYLLGIFFVNAIIWRGMGGILLCVAMLFPHMIFYTLGYYIILCNYYRYSEQLWSSRKVLVCVTFFFVGFFLEVYVNPMIVKGILYLV